MQLDQSGYSSTWMAFHQYPWAQMFAIKPTGWKIQKLFLLKLPYRAVVWSKVRVMTRLTQEQPRLRDASSCIHYHRSTCTAARSVWWPPIALEEVEHIGPCNCFEAACWSSNKTSCKWMQQTMRISCRICTGMGQKEIYCWSRCQKRSSPDQSEDWLIVVALVWLMTRSILTRRLEMIVFDARNHNKRQCNSNEISSGNVFPPRGDPILYLLGIIVCTIYVQIVFLSSQSPPYPILMYFRFRPQQSSLAVSVWHGVVTNSAFVLHFSVSSTWLGCGLFQPPTSPRIRLSFRALIVFFKPSCLNDSCKSTPWYFRNHDFLSHHHSSHQPSKVN